MTAFKGSTTTTKSEYRVRKIVNGKHICDIGSFATFDEAVNYAKHNLGAPEQGAEYLPILRSVEETINIYEMP